MCLLSINLPNLCPNMNNFDAVDFSECHSEEVMFLLTLRVYIFLHFLWKVITASFRRTKGCAIWQDAV